VVLERKSPDKRGSYKFGPWTSIRDYLWFFSVWYVEAHTVYIKPNAKGKENI
jgi:hypothetical protein